MIDLDSYSIAREQYASVGVDTEQAIERLGEYPPFHPLLAGGRYPGL